LRQWKLTDEDWRNREHHADYTDAIEEMLKRTDRDYAPWTVVSAESKRNARVAVLEAVIAAVESGMARAGHEPPPSLVGGQ
jgi:polyphosphate kinase 2 (PPK2 family)